MAYTPQKHNRQSIRLKGYDYTQPGAYSITIRAKNGRHLFGKIVNGEMQLNEWGRIVEEEWRSMGESRPNVELDEFQIMPNHLHAILFITQPNTTKVEDGLAKAPRSERPAAPQYGKPQKGSLGSIIGTFKSCVTREINKLEQTSGSNVWQRGYYDRIIRNEKHLEAVRQYIRNNPAKWEEDDVFNRRL